MWVGKGNSLPDYQEVRITGDPIEGWLSHSGKSLWVRQGGVRFKQGLEETEMTGEVRLQQRCEQAIGTGAEAEMSMVHLEDHAENLG